MSKSPREIEEVIGLEFSVDTVFALLPDETAAMARQAVLDTYYNPDGRFSGAIRWADFDFDGTFKRGGVSELGDLSTRILGSPDDDPELVRLVALARQLKLKPGLIESLPGEDKMFWFVPFTPSSRDQIPQTVLRGLSITLELFSQIVDRFNPDGKLTAAEMRVCFQFLAGRSLREAATADDLSVETKRLQMKQAVGKLDCDGQAGLVRLLVGQLVHFVHASEGQSAQSQLAESFAADHLPPNVRLLVQRLPNGRILRLYECGPAHGTPVLMLHGFVFPFVPLNGLRALEDNNIRLLIPIRSGYLDENAATNIYHDEDAVERTINDLTLYLKTFWSSPIPLLGELAGGPVAVRLAEKEPDLFSHVILLAINVAKGDATDQTFVRRFHGGLRQLLSKPTIFRFIAWQFRKFNSTPKAMRTTMIRLMRECPVDVAALEGEIGTGPAYGWLSAFLQHSPVGYADDFRMIIKGDWVENFPKLRSRVTFVHGVDDSLTTMADIQSLMARYPAARLFELEGAGHFPTASHPGEVWARIAAIIDE